MRLRLRSEHESVDAGLLGPALVILGAPRSGTSLVYRALCAHPDVAFTSNWVRRAARLPQLSALNRASRWSPGVRNRVWFGADGSDAYAYGRKRSSWERLFPQPVEGEPLYALAGVPDEPGVQFSGNADQQRRLRALYASVARWGGGKVLVVKRVANNRRVPLLQATLPGCRFVHVLRDGRAVANSLSRVDWWDQSPLFWYGGSPAQWGARGGDPWVACARHWVEEVRAIDDGLANVDADRQLEVRFESIVSDPRGVLAEIGAFAGLAPDPRWDEALDHLDVLDRNKPMRDSPDIDALSIIEGVQADELLRRGYQLT